MRGRDPSFPADGILGALHSGLPLLFQPCFFLGCLEAFSSFTYLTMVGQEDAHQDNVGEEDAYDQEKLTAQLIVLCSVVSDDCEDAKNVNRHGDHVVNDITKAD